MLSAKHILSTSTENINFNEEFTEFFNIVEGYRIQIRDDIDNLENFDLRINKNKLLKVQDIQDLMQNEYVLSFEIYDKENEKSITISEASNINIFIADYLFKQLIEKRKHKEYDSEGYISFPMDKLDSDEDLFFVVLKNNELTKSLKELKSLIEKGKEINDVKNISDLIDKLNSLMKSGGIHVPSIHIEVLARNLVRDKNDILQLPDYTKENPEYIITSIHNSIMHSNSVINSLTFERLRQQLSDPNTYRKDGLSPLDQLFILE